MSSLDLVSSQLSSTSDYYPKSSNTPRVQLKLNLDKLTKQLYVTVYGARDLPAKQPCNAFFRLKLLSSSDPHNNHTSRVISGSVNPKWCETFAFQGSSVEDLLRYDLEVTIWDVDRKLDKSAFVGEVIINLSRANLSESVFWYPLQPDRPARHQAAVLSPIGAYQSKKIPSSARLDAAFMRSGYELNMESMEPGPIGLRLRSQLSNYDDRTESPYRKPRDQFQYNSGRFVKEPLEDEALGDLSEISNTSEMSKMSYRSAAYMDQEEYDQNMNTPIRGRVEAPRYYVSDLAMMDQRYKGRKESICSSAVSTSVADDYDFKRGHETRKGSRSTLELDERRSSASGETQKSKTSTIGDNNRKRRPSIGQKFSNVLGLNRKSSSTSNLDKKSRASFQRSEEVLPAHIRPTTERIGASGYTAPGAVNAGTGFGGISSGAIQRTSSACPPAGSGPSESLRSKQSMMLHRQVSASSADMPTGTDSGLQSSIDGTNASGEAHVGEFVEGLGPGQLVGRQVLGMPSLGEIQLSFVDRKGRLDVEVIRARGLQQKSSARVLPQPYVKLHLLEGKQSVEKLRTTNPTGKTLDPLYQQQFSFSTPYHGKILQVSVWGDFGRAKKAFLGMCEIVLDDLDISQIVFGWYKLFGMIASTSHSHAQRGNR
ncbi:Regulating synaptic membrane exocytosis protein 2 [Cichlidogyrus casuarinus]|uniref:Regulating synaptic membrane exocytosis protein 2 n=1 Tax=Cichlidogyrus casuarinus TaxID=1844966 RepID=A0ABD2Q6Y8_9PLAT